jgi:hypothetical protein
MTTLLAILTLLLLRIVVPLAVMLAIGEWVRRSRLFRV